MSSTTYTIGDIKINRLGYGGMRLTGKGVWGDPSDRDNAKRVLKEALQLGVNFIDTADAYGPHTNEQLIADALYPYPKDLLIATKGGLERPGPEQWKVNGRPEHIKKAIDSSLKRLKLNHIDLWQLHRIDPSVPVEETLGPVADAVRAGKVRYVGLSEVNRKEIERAEKTISIVSVQNMYNLGERKWDEVVDYTAGRNIAFIPWYPLAASPAALESKVSTIAKRHNATTAQVALAWLLRRSPTMLLIPGTSSLAHLKENMHAAALNISDEEFKQI